MKKLIFIPVVILSILCFSCIDEYETYKDPIANKNPYNKIMDKEPNIIIEDLDPTTVTTDKSL